MATSKKKREPKVGDIVCVQWIDSGKDYAGTFHAALRENLAISNCYGKIAHIDENRIIVASDVSDDNEERSNWGIIWIPAILKITYYKEF